LLIIDNNKITLSKRLKKIASYIPVCKSFADIGTDHGYLAIYAIQEKLAKKVIASDISKKPLNQAKKQIKNYSLENAIETRLGPGLNLIEIDEVEGVVIAGMGGSNIYNILENDLKKSRLFNFLVLQPQNNSNYVREWLSKNGYEITKEGLVKENNIIYQIILAKPGKSKKYKDIELDFGLISNIETKILLEELIKDKINKYEKILLEMNNSENNDIINKRDMFIKEVNVMKSYLSDL